MFLFLLDLALSWENGILLDLIKKTNLRFYKSACKILDVILLNLGLVQSCGIKQDTYKILQGF